MTVVFTTFAVNDSFSPGVEDNEFTSAAKKACAYALFAGTLAATVEMEELAA
jgi:hypothetical protein